jgi:hypothetical protein
VQLEGLSKLDKNNHCSPSACNILPQPTTLQRLCYFECKHDEDCLKCFIECFVSMAQNFGWTNLREEMI